MQWLCSINPPLLDLKTRICESQWEPQHHRTSWMDELREKMIMEQSAQWRQQKTERRQSEAWSEWTTVVLWGQREKEVQRTEHPSMQWDPGYRHAFVKYCAELQYSFFFRVIFWGNWNMNKRFPTGNIMYTKINLNYKITYYRQAMPILMLSVYTIRMIINIVQIALDVFTWIL